MNSQQQKTPNQIMPHTEKFQKEQAETALYAKYSNNAVKWPANMAPPIGGTSTPWAMSSALALVHPENPFFCYRAGFMLVKYWSEEDQAYICDCKKCPPMPRRPTGEPAPAPSQ